MTNPTDFQKGRWWQLTRSSASPSWPCRSPAELFWWHPPPPSPATSPPSCPQFPVCWNKQLLVLVVESKSLKSKSKWFEIKLHNCFLIFMYLFMNLVHKIGKGDWIIKNQHMTKRSYSLFFWRQTMVTGVRSSAIYIPIHSTYRPCISDDTFKTCRSSRQTCLHGNCCWYFGTYDILVCSSAYVVFLLRDSN